MKRHKPPDWLVWILENTSVRTEPQDLKYPRILWTIAKAPFAFSWVCFLCACASPFVFGDYLFSKRR